VFCCDANFGILPRDVEIARYVAEIKARRLSRCAVRPEHQERDRARLPDAEDPVRRRPQQGRGAVAPERRHADASRPSSAQNISLEDYSSCSARFTRDRVETYSDLILGLPGETYDASSTASRASSRAGQHNRIQFNNCSILPERRDGRSRLPAHYGLVTVECPIVNIHGALEDRRTASRRQELVIATTRHARRAGGAPRASLDDGAPPLRQAAADPARRAALRSAGWATAA
jgi:hypothetical protein